MTTRQSSLRAVGANEKAPAARKKLTVAQAAKTGKQRDLLVAMRDRIAEAVSSPDCQPRDLAALTKRLQDVVRDIAMMDTITEGEQSTTANGTIDNAFDSSAI